MWSDTKGCVAQYARLVQKNSNIFVTCFKIAKKLIQKVCGGNFERGPVARRHEETCAPISSKTLEDLSDPDILLILKKLEVADLLAVAGTSRRLRALAKDFSLWTDVEIEIPRWLTGDGSDEAEGIIDGFVAEYLNERTRSLTIRHGRFKKLYCLQ